MIRVKGRYRNQRLELDHPLNLPDGEEVEVEIRPLHSEDEEWRQLGMERLESDWENPKDAVYDDWRKLYGGERG